MGVMFKTLATITDLKGMLFKTVATIRGLRGMMVKSILISRVARIMMFKNGLKEILKKEKVFRLVRAKKKEEPLTLLHQMNFGELQ